MLKNSKFVQATQKAPDARPLFRQGSEEQGVFFVYAAVTSFDANKEMDFFSSLLKKLMGDENNGSYRDFVYMASSARGGYLGRRDHIHTLYRNTFFKIGAWP